MKSWAYGIPGMLVRLTCAHAAVEEDWFPSRYGAVGALGSADARRTAKLVPTGKVYQIGGITGRKTPAYGHRNGF